MKIIYFFMQEHLGKIYVPICEYKVCVSFCDVFLIGLVTMKIWAFSIKFCFLTCTKLLMAIWPSSLYLFPKSTFTSCKVHLAIVLLGYFAKLSLFFYQVHFQMAK